LPFKDLLNYTIFFDDILNFALNDGQHLLSQMRLSDLAINNHPTLDVFIF